MWHKPTRTTKREELGDWRESRRGEIWMTKKQQDSCCGIFQGGTLKKKREKDGSPYFRALSLFRTLNSCIKLPRYSGPSARAPSNLTACSVLFTAST